MRNKNIFSPLVRFKNLTRRDHEKFNNYYLSGYFIVLWLWK